MKKASALNEKMIYVIDRNAWRA